jgi:hypothetical protein
MTNGSKPFVSIATRLEPEQKVSDNVNVGGQRGDKGLSIIMSVWWLAADRHFIAIFKNLKFAPVKVHHSLGHGITRLWVFIISKHGRQIEVVAYCQLHKPALLAPNAGKYAMRLLEDKPAEYDCAGDDGREVFVWHLIVMAERFC